MAREDDVTMDAIKYLESRLPPGIEGDTLVDGGTLAIAIGEFDAAQKRADALAAENARLRELLHRIIACESWLVEDLTMPDTYYCAVCDEQADDDGVVAHKDGCPVADARRALEGGASTPDSVRVKLRLRYVGELPPPELRDEDVLEDDAP
jgi:hypothetical protein